MNQQFKVNGLDIEVKYTEPGSWTENGMGRCQYMQAEIQVRAGMPDRVRGQILIHELVHMILDMHSIELPEQTVCVIANSFYSLLVDNPDEIQQLIR